MLKTGARITLVKPQFLCGPPSFSYGWKNMTDTTDAMSSKALQLTIIHTFAE